MSEPPDPGPGWRIAGGDDWKDERCEYWDKLSNSWVERSLSGLPFVNYGFYRIPIEELPPTGIEKQVCADITQRQQLGIAKYGTTVADDPLSLREWLMHAYQECLDQAIYLRRAIAEIDAKEYGD